MATSGTVTNTFNCAKIIDISYQEGQGVSPEKLNSAHIKNAIDLIDFILADWNNKGILSWATKHATISMVAGTTSYLLPNDCIDVLEVVIYQGGSDSDIIPLSRIDRGDYEFLPDKDTQGTPDRFFIDRGVSSNTIYLWQTPSSSTDTLDYWYMRRLEDSGEMTNTLDLPYRWSNALQTELSYRLFKILPFEQRNAATNVGVLLKREAQEAFDSAKAEDRNKSPINIIPANFGWGTYSGI